MGNIKKRILIPAAAIICLIASGGYFWIHHIHEQENQNQEEPALVINPNAATGKVFRLSLKSTFQGDGVVAGDERGYLDIYEGVANMEPQTKKGEYVKAGDVLLSNGQETIVCQGSGYVTDIYINQEFSQVTVLNEEHLYVDLHVPYGAFGLMNYDSKVSVKEGSEVYSGYIHQLGYIYQDGYVDISVGFEGYIMPGKTVAVDVELCESGEKLWINADFVSNQGGVMTTYVVDNYEQKLTHVQEIKVGECYRVIDNENEFYYYEVLGGLAENQQIATAPLMIDAKEAEKYNDEEFDFK